MTTNIIATIIVCLTTNVAQQIQSNRIDPFIPAIGFSPGFDRTVEPRKLPDLKFVTSEVYEQRLLIFEAEGLKFTNVLASVLKQRTSETFVQRIPTPPAPTWELDTNRTLVQTNFAGGYSDLKFGTITFTNLILK